MILRILVALLLVGGLTAASGAAVAQEVGAEQRLPFQVVAPGISIADPFPFWGFDLNPAAIGLVQGVQGAFVAGNEIQGAGIAGALFKRVHLGFGIDHLEAVEGAAAWRTNLEIGVSLSKKLMVGFTWQHLFASDLMAGLDPLALGLLYRPFRWLSIGLAAYNMTEEAVDDQTDTLELREGAGLASFGAGLAVRPGTDRFTIGFDLVTNRGGDYWDPSAYLAVEIIEGLRVGANGWFAQLDDGWQWGVGGSLTLSTPLGDVFAGYKNSGGDNHDYVAAVRLTSVPESTVIAAGGKFVSMAMPGAGQEEKTGGLLSASPPTLLETRILMAQIANDPTVDGVIFSIAPLSMGWAQAQELAASVKLLRDKGKVVVAYIVSGGNKAYYIASHANHVVANPAMLLQIDGIFHTRYFLADLLKSIGVEVQSVRIGKYKTYPEQYTRNEPSPEHLEALNRMMDGFFSQLVQGIAAARKVEPAKVEKWIDTGVFTAPKAKAAGLVDHVATLNDVPGILAHFGIKNVQLTRSYPARPARDDRWGATPQIAVLLIEGSLVDGASWSIPLLGYKYCGGTDLRIALRQIEANPAISGLLLRINSGGGSALASELVHNAVKKLAKTKPVVVSIANSAASGGYYIAVASDTIYLMPGSVTGSIGIWFAKYLVTDLLDWLKIHRIHVQKGEHAGSFNYDRKLTEEELAMALERLQDLYDLFLTRVAENRNMTTEQVDSIGRGQVWNGEEAMKLKLVDHFGGSYEALQALKKKVGIKAGDPVELVYFPQKSLTKKLTKAILGIEEHTDLDMAEQETNIISFITYLTQTFHWAKNPWL